MACSTCLWGTRRPTTAIIGVGSLPGRTGTTGSVPLCTTATRSPVAPPAPQLGAGRAGDRNVLAPPVEERGHPVLDPPTDPADQAGIDHGPLLAVHMVDQHHHRPCGDQPREEGQPVLHVHHEVDLAQVAAAQRSHPRRVDRELRAPANEPHAVDRLLRWGGRVRRAEDGDLAAALDQARRHLLQVALGAAALGIVGVAPAEEGDLLPLQLVQVAHREHRIGCAVGSPACPVRPPSAHASRLARPRWAGRVRLCCGSSATSSPTRPGSTPRSAAGLGRPAGATTPT